MNEINHSRSRELLEKVYDHLDGIDLGALSMSEIKDFLGVVQQGQFLESLGKMPTYALGGFNAPSVSNAGNGDTGDFGGGNETSAPVGVKGDIGDPGPQNDTGEHVGGNETAAEK